MAYQDPLRNSANCTPTPETEYSLSQYSKHAHKLLSKLLRSPQDTRKKIYDNSHVYRTSRSENDLCSLFSAQLVLPEDSTLLDHLGERLDQLYQLTHQIPLQDPTIAYQLASATELASFLIDERGAWRERLMKPLVERFLSSSTRPITNSLHEGLLALINDPSLRQQISSLSPPVADASALLIRATLHIPLDVPLSNGMVRRAVLSALLAHPRQGQQGSCFATSLAICIHANNKNQLVNDLLQLIKYGYLTRNLKKEIITFPFLPLIQDGEGLTVLSPKQVHLLTDALATAHASKTSPSTPLSVELTKELHAHPSKNIKELFSAIFPQNPLPYLAFLSTTYHPLLAAWENSLAAMAEANEEGILHQALSNTIIYYLQEIATEQSLLPYFLSENIETKIRQALTQRVSYLYDPTYRSHSNPKETGGFLLLTKGNQIINEEQFFLFLKNLLSEICPLLSSEQLHTDAISKILALYHQGNRKQIGTIPRYTPWATAIGNDPKNVWRTYQEPHRKVKIDSLTPYSATDLLLFFIRQITALDSEQRRSYSQVGRLLTPVRIVGLHSFSLILNHPSISACYQPHFLASNWIEERLANPGRQLEQTTIDTLSLQNLIQNMASHLIPSTQQEAFLKACKDLPSNWSCLRTQLIFLAHSYKTPHHKIAEWVDHAIIDHLSLEKRKIFESSAIHFADTNWQVHGIDVHYGFVWNPGTGRIEIAQFLATGKFHRFLNQTFYFSQQKWEFCFL